MDVIAKLLRMKEVPNSQVFLLNGEYGNAWRCSFEGKIEGVKVEIVHTEPLLSLAVQKTYDKFLSFLEANPEFRGPLLEHQPAADQVFDVPLSEVPDDEIPF